MRVLYLEDLSIMEIQEPKDESNDLLVAFWSSMEFFYNRDKKVFYQFQEWPSNKEIQEKTKELNAMEDKEESQRLFEEAKADRKARSKKVVYKLLTKPCSLKQKFCNVSQIIEDIIDWENLTKEYID